MANKVDLKGMLASVTMEDKAIVISRTIEGFIRQILSLSAEDDLDYSVSFHDLGLDSITAVTLKTMLCESLGEDFELSSSEIFNYPNINMLAEHISNKLKTKASSSLKEPKE